MRRLFFLLLVLVAMGGQGQTLTLELRDEPLLKALQTLGREQSEYSINKVAELVGYPNASYFNRQFKNGLGMTPTEFRREYQEQEAI